MTSHEIPTSECPACHHKQDRASLVTDNPEGHGPQPGDVSLCMYCGTWLEFLEGGRMQSLPPDKLSALPQETQNEMAKIKTKWASFKMMKEYEKQIETMAERAAAWRAANPSKVVKIQFNYQRAVFVVSPISSAIEKHLLSADDAGIELIKTMWPWDDPLEPTVAMVRIALEMVRPAAPRVSGDRPAGP